MSIFVQDERLNRNNNYALTYSDVLFPILYSFAAVCNRHWSIRL